MFGKLLKHDWRAVRGLVGLLCAVVGLSGLLAGGSLRHIVWFAVQDAPGTMTAYAFVLAAAVITIPVCCVLAMYLLLYRFYQSRFSDQGYLMLTLPVSTHQHLLSCILNTVIGVSLVSLTAVLAAAAAMGAYFRMFPEESAAEVMEQLRNANIDMGLTAGTMLLEIPEFLISFVAEIILLMAAMIVGSKMSKHPVFYGVLIYIGINELVSLGCECLGSYIQAPTLLTAVSCLIYGALAAGAYFAAYTIMEKHLNLT